MQAVRSLAVEIIPLLYLQRHADDIGLAWLCHEAGLGFVVTEIF
jgi:hypothetical protein